MDTTPATATETPRCRMQPERRLEVSLGGSSLAYEGNPGYVLLHVLVTRSDCQGMTLAEFDSRVLGLTPFETARKANEYAELAGSLLGLSVSKAGGVQVTRGQELDALYDAVDEVLGAWDGAEYERLSASGQQAVDLWCEDRASWDDVPPDARAFLKANRRHLTTRLAELASAAVNL